MNNKQEIENLEKQILSLEASVSEKKAKLDQLRQEALFEFEIGDVWKSATSSPVIIAANRWSAPNDPDYAGPETFFFVGLEGSLRPFSSFSNKKTIGGVSKEEMRDCLKSRGFRKLGNINADIQAALARMRG